MQGSSRAAAATVQEAFAATLEGPADRRRLGEDLFAVTDAVDANVPLRRALSDPSREGPAKAAVVEQLLAGKISGEALDLVKTAVSGRWSEEHDLVDTLERLAVGSIVGAAERDGQADQLEDELFRFERIVAGNPALRDALTDRRSSAEGKTALITELLQRRASDDAVRLVRQAVSHPRGRRFDQVLDSYLREAATRRDQLAATVTSAIVLDEGQRERLAAALERHYHKTVHLNVVVDPAVVGGIRVQIGDDVVDGTILRRLDEARRHLGG